MTKIPELNAYVERIWKLSFKPLIISAGMHRSGSTLLFNIVREILLSKWGRQLACGWEDDVKELPRAEIYLLKTHRLSRFYRLRANRIVYSYRDVRVAAVSRMRKFDHPIAIEAIRLAVREFEVAKNANCLMIKYEELIAAPTLHIQDISNFLNVDVDVEEIFDRSFGLQPPDDSETGPYSRETLLHKSHFTFTEEEDWRSIIPVDLQKEISKEFAWWFKECGYSIE